MTAPSPVAETPRTEHALKVIAPDWTADQKVKYLAECLRTLERETVQQRERIEELRLDSHRAWNEWQEEITGLNAELQAAEQRAERAEACVARLSAQPVGKG